MRRLDAHAMFDARGDDREALDCDATIGGLDAWPAAAVAAVELAGHLDDAASHADLDVGLEHFQRLYEAGIVTDEKWQETSIEILGDLESWGEETDRIAAMN